MAAQAAGMLCASARACTAIRAAVGYDQLEGSVCSPSPSSVSLSSFDGLRARTDCISDGRWRRRPDSGGLEALSRNGALTELPLTPDKSSARKTITCVATREIGREFLYGDEGGKEESAMRSVERDQDSDEEEWGQSAKGEGMENSHG
ncbi:hypothetical protein CBR_g23981 [Chara braunii]|uniref:Uncharacterized protein n=1 Tax=Chara braunii TaxID=69332 RepID=A0A388L5F8_CHABU|nr:hypothetical protein CBR_g23981 [Chara braunii]|eukprot:GBG77536.1 hypothetical protein CBR_g23981 [Chara braunii]